MHFLDTKVAHCVLLLFGLLLFVFEHSKAHVSLTEFVLVGVIAGGGRAVYHRDNALGI